MSVGNPRVSTCDCTIVKKRWAENIYNTINLPKYDEDIGRHIDYSEKKHYFIRY